MSEMPVLDVRGLRKSYGRKLALQDFSVRVERGQVHGLLGPNGSGKSTCLHILAGLLNPDQGDAAVCGVPVADKESRRRYGFAPDDLPLPGALTGREFLAFHDALRNRDDRDRAQELVEVLRLEGDIDVAIGSYSHGMRRKVQLIAALMHDPDLLILDEPYRGLDPEASAILRLLITGLARSGRAVLVATHDMVRAERDCSEVSILDHGALVASGPPDAVIARHAPEGNLEDALLHATGLADARDGAAGRLTTLFTPRS